MGHLDEFYVFHVAQVQNSQAMRLPGKYYVQYTYLENPVLQDLKLYF